MLPPTRNAYFYKIGCLQVILKKVSKIEVFGEQNPLKIVLKTHVFLNVVLEGVWTAFSEGLGRVLGGGLEPLGLSWAVFWLLFCRLGAQEGARGAQELSWPRF